MITTPDPTPEQRTKMLRTQRGTAIAHAIFGLAYIGLAVFELSRGRGSAYRYIMPALGILYVCMSWFAWSRAKKYA